MEGRYIYINLNKRGYTGISINLTQRIRSKHISVSNYATENSEKKIY